MSKDTTISIKLDTRAAGFDAYPVTTTIQLDLEEALDAIRATLAKVDKNDLPVWLRLLL